MSNEAKLKQINNEIKVYINESNFISIKFRNKLIKMLGQQFLVNLPLENFASIDIVLEEDGSIIMRGDKYQPAEKITTFEELEEKYISFKEKADAMLNKKDTNYYNKRDFDNILNLFIIILIILVFIGLLILGIRALLFGNYINCIWLIMFSSSWLIPGLKENLIQRIDQAKIYLKRKLKK